MDLGKMGLDKLKGRAREYEVSVSGLTMLYMSLSKPY